jgi:hypothetical protein
MEARRPSTIFVLLLLGAAGGSCHSSGSKELPACEGPFASLRARTVDGQRTIAAVELSPKGECTVGSGCSPAVNGGDAGSEAPCAEVSIVARGASTHCAMTFVSMDGRSFSADASVRKQEGSDYQCRNGPYTYTAYAVAFDPREITVDFAQGSPGPPDGSSGAP